jgi:protein N-terminal methyltransferase
VRSLRELKQCLKDDGVIIVKENVILSDSKLNPSRRQDYAIDKMDHSVTRTENHLLSLFLEAGLKVGDRMNQTGFPDDLYPVVMYALVRNDE